MVLVSLEESNLALPWVPEIFFSCVTRGFVGRRPTRLRPSAEDTSREKKLFARVTFYDLTETRNRAWKVSGTQGNLA